jgi:hypothetical protein
VGFLNGHRSAFLRLVAVAYVVALATLPFGHHDLLCHLKSSTHCTTCLVGTSADDSGTQPPVPPIILADAGQADESADSLAVSCVRASSSGRSPPSTSLNLA